MFVAPVSAYALAAGVTLLAAALRLALEPVLGRDVPYLTFFAAVAVSARLGGLGPGLLATALSAVAAAYLFGVQAGRRLTWGDGIGLLLFVGIGWLISSLSDRLRRAHTGQEVEASRLRAILRSIGDGVVVTDRDGRVQALNPVAEALTGWSAADAEGEDLATVFRIVNEDTRAEVPNPAYRALRDDTIVGLANHTLLVSRAGDERPIDDSAAPIRGAGGEVQGSVLIFRDVSERRRAHAALRASEKELSDFFEHATLAIHWIDCEGTILRANRAELQMMGYEAPAYVGRRIADFHDDKAAIADILGRLAAGDDVRDYAARVVCRDGTLKDVLVNSSVLWENGRFVHTRCFTLDVSDRKRAEEARARLAAIIESSDDAVISKTLDGRILTWNRGAEKMFGYGESDAIGQPVTLIIPDELHAAEREVLARVARGERLEPFETVRVARGGQRLDVSLTLSPIHGDHGAIIGASAISRDIGRQKHLEQSLREADRRKDEFLALLAHELRNPLAPIWSSVAAMQMTALDDPRLRHATDVIARQARHMARLLDDLLDVSRITRDKLDLQKESVPLLRVVDLALETSRPIIDANRQTLTVEARDRSLVVDADTMRLAQVFSNLVSNASKYSPPHSTIRVTVARDGAEAVVTVADDGVGIPPEALPTIFEMFSQASPALDRAQSGLGIGLALVKGLVEHHGGRVGARSAGAGKGSAFEVRLPVAQAVEGAGSRDVSAPGTPGVHRRVVIADDNRDGADSLAIVLRAYGHEVRTAYDGAAAVAVAAEFRPHVLLLDLGMPVVNGYEAARMLRATPEGHSLLLVAVTGWGQERDREQTRAAGFDAHFVKPVDPGAIQQFLVASAAAGQGNAASR